jgi:hypothetical protein
MRQLQNLSLVVMKLGQMPMHLLSESGELRAFNRSLKQRCAKCRFQGFNRVG